MSEDWKKQVDEQLVMKNRQHTAAEKAFWETKEAGEREMEVAKKRDEHRNLFKCSVDECENRSQGPYVSSREGASWNPVYGVTRWTTTVVYWNIPTGLQRCLHCEEYVCRTHYHEERKICYNCFISMIELKRHENFSPLKWLKNVFCEIAS